MSGVVEILGDEPCTPMFLLIRTASSSAFRFLIQAEPAPMLFFVRAAKTRSGPKLLRMVKVLPGLKSHKLTKEHTKCKTQDEAVNFFRFVTRNT